MTHANMCANYVRNNINNIYNNNKGNKQKIGIKMFSKNLYGRILWNNN